MESKAIRPPTGGRSSQYHVVGGLSFLEAFKAGDIDACAEYLHPEVEWHPTPTMVDHEAIKGRHAVRYTLEAVRDRYQQLELEPEDGRQVGQHMLLIALLRGANAFHGGEQRERACWVVTMQDELWRRVVVYPNAPWARVGFEELIRAVGGEPGAPPPPPPPDPLEGRSVSVPAMAAPDPLQGGTDPFRGDRLAVDVEQSTTPAAAPAAAPAPAGSNAVTLELTFEEADALARWLLKPSQDGSAAMDDAAVKPSLMKLRQLVEREQSVRNVRKELEQAGIPTQQLTDQQVVQLGRRIAAAAGPAMKSE